MEAVPLHCKIYLARAAFPPRREGVSPRARQIGAALVVAVLVAGAVVLHRSGVDGPLLQEKLLALGVLAPPLFLLLFALGELLHLPGILFVLAARVVFGPSLGFLLGYVGAVLAVTISFTVARQLLSAARATREPWRPRWRVLRRAFERIESSPIRTIAVLRLVLWLAPPLSYALASSGVRGKDHFVGTALGLVLPVLGVAVLGSYL
jgi:uncharacterized membrane protein YdjX (TVP38/TMEM64 family)